MKTFLPAPVSFLLTFPGVPGLGSATNSRLLGCGCPGSCPGFGLSSRHLQTYYGYLAIIYMNLKLITMSNKSYTLMKIGWRLFGLNWPDLTDEQKSEVIDIYYDFY